MLHFILGVMFTNVYSFTMRGLPGELMTREKLTSRERPSQVTHLWACDRTIFRIKIQTQRKYTYENK